MAAHVTAMCNATLSEERYLRRKRVLGNRSRNRDHFGDRWVYTRIHSHASLCCLSNLRLSACANRNPCRGTACTHTHTHTQCETVLFVAKGREFKFFGDNWKCGTCGAGKEFVIDGNGKPVEVK